MIFPVGKISSEEMERFGIILNPYLIRHDAIIADRQEATSREGVVSDVSTSTASSTVSTTGSISTSTGTIALPNDYFFNDDSSITTKSSIFSATSSSSSFARIVARQNIFFRDDSTISTNSSSRQLTAEEPTAEELLATLQRKTCPVGVPVEEQGANRD